MSLGAHSVAVVVFAVIHVSMAATCGSTSAGASDVCFGGYSTDDDDQSRDGDSAPWWIGAPFQWYAPALINTLAALLLSFYANTVIGHYRETYAACQSLKQSVVDITTMICGTIHPQNVRALLEFWRCISLFHVSSYVLADRTRRVYSFDRFLIPVAEAFGKYDGAEQLGMFRRAELDAFLKIRAVDKTERRGSFEDDRGSRFSNMRADVQSDSALLHASLGVRLYRLVDIAITTGLTRAAWPAWHSALALLRRSSENVKQCALFRLPRVYHTAVMWVVYTSIMVDTFILGAKTGRMLSYGAQHDAWRLHAWFGSLLGFVVNVFVAYLLVLLLAGLRMMETPLGGQMLDMPALSYVCSASELTLRMVLSTAPSATGGTIAASTGFLAMNTMQWVEGDTVFGADIVTSPIKSADTMARTTLVEQARMTEDSSVRMIEDKGDGDDEAK